MCRIDYADDEGGRWLLEPTERTARKDHRCGDCGRPIDKGERYTVATWTSPDWGLTAVKMCAHCVAAGRWLRVICGGHFWPGVVEELEEHWDEERHSVGSFSLGMLVVLARARWRRHGALVDLERVRQITQRAIDRVPVEARH